MKAFVFALGFVVAVAVVEATTCPDGHSQCPGQTTCCKLANGQYGCCPMVNAVCCNDHIHCCPSGTKCDVTHGKCIQGEKEFPLMKKFPAYTPQTTCPDGHSQCPGQTTCCKLANGQYGCCPMVNAVCCNDHVHCCPSGTKCDVTHGKCIQGDKELEMSKKFPAFQPDTTCPDGHSQCPGQTTCCKLSDGTYGCCPLVNAVCCTDHIHCCPSGTKCDVTGGKCIQGDKATDMFKKIPARRIRN